MDIPPLEAALAEAWPLEAWADVTVLVAVSGGADSVALLRGLAALSKARQARLEVAHVNHGLRGRESDRDQDFVQKLATDLGLACHSARLDPAQLHLDGDGLEAAARHKRYRFLTATAEQIGARYLAVAHTADDQIETILHRILRGTGIAGLAGMPRSRRLSEAVTLIRPLLDVTRADLLKYLQQIRQPFRDDESNNDPGFTRNRIRHELLPHLSLHYNPAVGEALLRLGRLAGQSQSVIDALVRQLITAGAVTELEEGLLVRGGELADQSDYLVRELLIHVWQAQGWPLQAMGFEEWSLLLRMFRGGSESPHAVPTKRTFPGQVFAEQRENGLYLQLL